MGRHLCLTNMCIFPQGSCSCPSAKVAAGALLWREFWGEGSEGEGGWESRGTNWLRRGVKVLANERSPPADPPPGMRQHQHTLFLKPKPVFGNREST